MSLCACRFATLTPPGRGAVASIAVFGHGAREVVARLFTPVAGRSLLDYPVGRVVVGHWPARGEDAGATNSPGEELVVSLRAPDQVEVHCHGGMAAIGAIVRSLEQEGCQAGQPVDWLRSQESDRLVIDARQALTQASTSRTAAILLDQYRGALSDAVDAIRRALVDSQTGTALRQLERLLNGTRLGEHLVRPWQIVLVGKTNVGKSSLINALLGYQRALVYHEAGTTRDILTDVTAFSGWPVELADTAGLRTAGDGIESEGIRRARQRAAQADLLLVVSDVSQTWTQDDAPWRASSSRAVILVHNKFDLVEAPPQDRPAGLLTSATTGGGIAELIDAITEHLVPNPPLSGTPLPFLPEHGQMLRNAWEAANAGDSQRAALILTQLQAPDIA